MTEKRRRARDLGLAPGILPHAGDLYQEKVPAGLAIGNGFGKLVGATQLVERYRP